MGGKPSSGTRKDRRLKGNKKKKRRRALQPAKLGDYYLRGLLAR
jgi:hypothetical protein